MNFKLLQPVKTLFGSTNIVQPKRQRPGINDILKQRRAYTLSFRAVKQHGEHSRIP